jgi:hypothetical protein
VADSKRRKEEREMFRMVSSVLLMWENDGTTSSIMSNLFKNALMLQGLLTVSGKLLQPGTLVPLLSPKGTCRKVRLVAV